MPDTMIFFIQTLLKNTPLQIQNKVKTHGLCMVYELYKKYQISRYKEACSTNRSCYFCNKNRKTSELLIPFINCVYSEVYYRLDMDPPCLGIRRPTTPLEKMIYI